jgi:hypothetical protein
MKNRCAQLWGLVCLAMGLCFEVRVHSAENHVLHFDGANSGFDAPPRILQGATNLTIAVWIRPGRLNWARFVSIADGSATEIALLIRGDHSGIELSHIAMVEGADAGQDAIVWNPVETNR